MRNTFNLAGQDSYTDPPAQNSDLFSQLVNVQPPTRGDLNRRWGYGVQTQGLFPSLSGLGQVTVTGLYQNSLTDFRQLVYMAGNNPVAATDELGGISNPNIFTPSGVNPIRMMSARNYGYFADGAPADYRKWDGGNVVTNWGIDINNVGALTFGPNGPQQVQDLFNAGGGGTDGPIGPTSAYNASGIAQNWSNPGGVATQNNDYSTQVTLSAPNNIAPNPLYTTGYTFAPVPAGATITGILVEVLCKQTVSNQYSTLTANLTLNGVVVGNYFPTLVPGTTGAYLEFGGSTTTWGAGLTPANVNSGLLACRFGANNVNGTPSTFEIDYVRMTVYFNGGAGSSWTNPNNIKVADGQVATANLVPSPTSELLANNFGLAVTPTNTITGIQVDFLADVTGSGGDIISPILVKGGAPYGNRKSVPVSGNTLGYFSAGGPSDLWGGNWLPSDINASNFGVQFYAVNGSGAPNLNIDFVRVTVFTSAGPITLGSPISGAITLAVGRIYTLVFKNSVTGHLSSTAPFSLSTGPLTNQNQPLTGLPVSADPQVDRKIILATADGGDETTLYFVAEVANSDITYTDSTPETTLLLQNIYADQDTTGNTLGVFDNDPPASALQFPINHRGRVYMATTTALYYSKAESDLVTASGTLCGKYEEAWPPLNYFALASEAESITGLLSDGQVLYIGTNTRVLRLYGDGPATFQEPEALFKHTGVLNQDVWKMILLQGNPLGAMWLTPDYRVLGSDFNTYQDVGQPIQNILDSINRAVAEDVIWASYVGISNWNLYVLAVPTGQNTQPDTFLVFDIKGKQWYIWQPTDQMLGGLWNVSLAGTPGFATVSATGNIYQWGPQFTQDQVGGLSPTSFPVTIESSWQDFTDAAARKYLNEIEIITDDPGILVTIEGSSTSAGFLTPNTVVATAALQTKPLGEYFVTLAPYSTRDRYYRYRLTSTDAVGTLLRGINIQGGVINRL